MPVSRLFAYYVKCPFITRELSSIVVNQLFSRSVGLRDYDHMVFLTCRISKQFRIQHQYSCYRKKDLRKFFRHSRLLILSHLRLCFRSQFPYRCLDMSSLPVEIRSHPENQRRCSPFVESATQCSFKHIETLRNFFSRIFIFVDDSDIISSECLASFYTQRNDLEEDAQRFL